MRRKSQRGSTMIEFVASTVFWMPLLVGTSVIGLNLIRNIQVTQLCRDAGHMYAYGVDFSQAANQNLLVSKLADGLNITATGGNGVVIFSTITMIGAAQCTAAGLAANTTNCPNLNRAVFARRIVVGNVAKRASRFGTPSPGIIGTGGFIGSTDQCTNTTARAGNFTSLLALNPGEFGNLTETYVGSPDYDWRGYMAGTGVYASVIF